MKLCISSTGKDLDADVDSRFGRCPYFLIIDTETMEINVLSNESIMSSGGAGIQAAQMVVKTGVTTVVTGNIGPNAFETLHAADIKVITGAHGIIKEVVEKYKKGELNETEAPNVGSHSGMRR